MPKSIADRLWSKVQRKGPEECWPFTGNTNKGYGQLKCVVDGKSLICRIRNGKTYQETGKTVKTYAGRSRAALG